MRLWTIHPRYLDPQGLVALWREALLAQAVLRNQTRGYKHHPQLQRFQQHDSPRFAINVYLSNVHAEATARGYNFDRSKIGPTREVAPIEATTGQLEYEWEHLRAKLTSRSPAVFERWRETKKVEIHPLFLLRPGPIADWEKI